MMWVRLDERAHMDELGYIPEFLSDDDPRPAKEQINDRYGPGGGWRPMPGCRLVDGVILTYPGDPPMRPLFFTHLHDNEIIMVYAHSFVVILQKDDSYEVARMD